MAGRIGDAAAGLARRFTNGIFGGTVFVLRRWVTMFVLLPVIHYISPKRSPLNTMVRPLWGWITREESSGYGTPMPTLPVRLSRARSDSGEPSGATGTADDVWTTELERAFAGDGCESDAEGYGRLSQLLAEAVLLAYVAPPGYYHDPEQAASGASGRPGMQRLKRAERLAPEGLAAIVLFDDTRRRAVVAYRGQCTNLTDSRCLRDHCATHRLRMMGGLDWLWPRAAAGSLACWWHFGGVDYMPDAEVAVERTLELLPGYALMLTGHSLGARLAAAVGARLGIPVAAVGLPPFDLAFWRDSSVASNSAPIWSIYDPWDPVYGKAPEESDGAEAARVCVFDPSEVPVAEACAKCVRSAGGSKPDLCRERCLAAHSVSSYFRLLAPKGRRRLCCRYAGDAAWARPEL